MAQTRITVGTRDTLAGEDVGAANVWARDGHPAPSVRLVFDDRDVIVGVGETVEAGGGTHRLIAIEPHPATNGHELVFELDPATRLPAPSPLASGTRSADSTRAPEPTRPPDRPSPPEPEPPPEPRRPSPRSPRPTRTSETIGIPKTSSDALADVLLALTPAVLARLGAEVEEIAWTVTSDDSYVVSGPGERLGPSTRTRHIATLPDGLRAEVETEVVRWGPLSVHSTTASGFWRVGDGEPLWCSGRGERMKPIREVTLRGAQTGFATVRAALA